jgi:glycosyltransferase involved in cell wall biosynthesis
VEAIYTLVDFLPPENRSFLNNLPVTHSYIQNLPRARQWRRHYLPLMPLAIESFDVSWADIVISSSSAIAKGVLTHGDQLHLCYCYSPARYAWDLTHQYLKESGLEKGLKAFLARLVLHYLRLWDTANSNRVDYFAAISRHIAQRLWHVYRRRSTVIYPPVDIPRFKLTSDKDDYYLTVSRLEVYKKVDLIVEAFARFNQKLVVVGDGPALNRIKAKATPNVEILGYQPDDVVQDLMERARGFIFAANEDFGIVSLEAQASGTPVIAYGRGASLETVRGVFPGTAIDSGVTGVFFREQTPDSLLEALEWFERHREKIDPQSCRLQAELFSRPRFEQEFQKFVMEKWNAFQIKHRCR